MTTMTNEELAQIQAANEEIQRYRNEPGSAEVELAVARAAQQMPALAWKLVDSDPVAYAALYRRVKAEFDRERYAIPEERRAALNKKQVPVVEKAKSAKPPRPNLKVPNEVTEGGEAGLRAAAAYLSRVSEGRGKGR